MSNLILVHPNCHKQIHCRKTDVVLPALTKGFGEEAAAMLLSYPTLKF
jgi:hypothetical protein